MDEGKAGESYSMREPFSFGRFVTLAGVAMGIIAPFGSLYFEPLSQRFGPLCPIGIYLVYWTVTGLICIDLSRKLSLRVIVIAGLIGWAVNFGVLAYEAHRQEMHERRVFNHHSQ